MKQIYLDYTANTPADPEVVQAMLPYFHDAFGNPNKNTDTLRRLHQIQHEHSEEEQE
jgi:cysteine sulfinate desulfinase/cysteine desulfurase-like protein